LNSKNGDTVTATLSYVTGDDTNLPEVNLHIDVNEKTEQTKIPEKEYTTQDFIEAPLFRRKLKLYSAFLAASELGRRMAVASELERRLAVNKSQDVVLLMDTAPLHSTLSARQNS
jgi:hypothetical protein